MVNEFGEDYVAWLSCEEGELGLSEDEYKKVLSFIQYDLTESSIKDIVRHGEPRYEFKFHYLPKVSMNQFYESKHWNFRKKTKDAFSLLLQRWHHCIDCSKKYDVDYEFTFKTRPLDTTNTTAMLKMIEDVLFEKDDPRVVRRVSTISKKGPRDCVIVKVWEVE